ncbi:MAG: hypothetical protein PF447_03995 [Spirochaetaceae bacterium]|jgi:hypothetical protein|nr:hypothetical protein [Spirochaetaceae bacterium]
MKYWFFALTILIVLTGCFVIPPMEFTFVNNSISETLTITPVVGAGEDWVEFTVAPETRATVKSQNSNLNFDYTPNSLQMEEYTGNYTFIFNDAEDLF